MRVRVRVRLLSPTLCAAPRRATAYNAATNACTLCTASLVSSFIPLLYHFALDKLSTSVCCVLCAVNGLNARLWRFARIFANQDAPQIRATFSQIASPTAPISESESEAAPPAQPSMHTQAPASPTTSSYSSFSSISELKSATARAHIV